jgi:hypothetical protein
MQAVKGTFAFFTGLFVLTAGALSVSAETGHVRYTEGLVDHNKTCTVTIYEYVSNNGDASVFIDGNAVGTEGLLPDGAAPVSEVGFSCMKIADLSSQDNVSGNISPARFTGLAPQVSSLLTELKVLSASDIKKEYQDFMDKIKLYSQIYPDEFIQVTSMVGDELHEIRCRCCQL